MFTSNLILLHSNKSLSDNEGWFKHIFYNKIFINFA